MSEKAPAPKAHKKSPDYFGRTGKKKPNVKEWYARWREHLPVEAQQEIEAIL